MVFIFPMCSDRPTGVTERLVGDRGWNRMGDVQRTDAIMTHCRPTSSHWTSAIAPAVSAALPVVCTPGSIPLGSARRECIGGGLMDYFAPLRRVEDVVGALLVRAGVLLDAAVLRSREPNAFALMESPVSIIPMGK